ncbi:hypothetical protein [Methyloligella solikamskensis]|uniref:Uncharacterized protein n=1 Tax=Methyloligella solikamskensis TaxID=1177756 RepID=A0ABW3J8I3_9HYPH
MLKQTLAAIGLTLAGAVAATSASAGQATIAVTPAIQTGAASADMITPVKRWHRDDWRYDRYRHGRYYDRHADYRYRHHHHDRYAPPPGWRRYSYAPYGWRDRGCINVGPVWYCS